MSGFVKLHRGWHDSPQFKNESYCERAAWAWLITNAAWKDTVRRTGQGAIVPVERGQLHVSLASLAGTWGWSIKRVRGFILRLEVGHNLGTVRAQSGTILTICNYGKYQDAGHSQVHEKGTVRAQSGHIQEEGKEIKKEENKGAYAFCGRVIKLNQADFDRWQKAYSRIDLMAQLQARDDWLWLQDANAKKNWFKSTSNWLAKKSEASNPEKGWEVSLC
jgi:hypothetical protein